MRVVGTVVRSRLGLGGAGHSAEDCLQGIDRYFERYYRKGPRRRPVRIDFCDADVLDVFDEWRRAVGFTAPTARRAKAAERHWRRRAPEPADAREAGGSLPAHLQRVVLRLTSASASAASVSEFDALIDRAARELDAARAEARGVRGPPARRCWSG